jgi:hypothetical protein
MRGFVIEPYGLHAKSKRQEMAVRKKKPLHRFAVPLPTLLYGPETCLTGVRRHR